MTWIFRDRDLESRDASQQEFVTCEMSKCQNAKTPFGVGRGHMVTLRKMEEGASATKLHFGASDTGTWSIKNSSPQERRSAEMRNRKSALWISARSPLVVTWSRAGEQSYRSQALFQELVTWRVETTHHRISEMRKCEIRFWCRL
jgi:hypothetical protein